MPTQKDVTRLTEAYNVLREQNNRKLVENERLTAEVEATRRLLEQTLDEKRILVQNNKALGTALTNAQHMIAVVVNPQLVVTNQMREQVP